jgi:ABC-type transport system involved in multi-copper enzyme maturation permease subunit
VTRFAWLQSRTQTLGAVAALAALAVAAAITGVHLSHLYNSNVAHCQTGCDIATGQFLSHDRFMDHTLDLLARAAPALIGIFWGAPLLTREFETGTYRLAWTQSVTRSRWLGTKLALVGAATVAVTGLLTLTITWWYRVLDPLTTSQYLVFDRRGIAPIGYAVFAFASGALIGAIIRRTVPAMATTLAVFVLARIGTGLWVRPHFMSPLHKIVSLTSGHEFGFTSSNGSPLTLVAKGSAGPNTWTLSNQVVTKTGHHVSSGRLAAFVQQYCPNITPPKPGGGGHRVVPPGGPAAFDACARHASHAFNLLITYQPANRYWTFQWLELGVFLVLAAAAFAGCYWWVTRRGN